MRESVRDERLRVAFAETEYGCRKVLIWVEGDLDCGLVNDLRDAEPGDKFIVTVSELTEREINSLPDFGGW